MNNIPSSEAINEKTKETKKRLSLYVILTSFVLFSISSFLLSPLYISLYSNIMYSDSFLADLINFVNNTLYIAVYAVCFPLFIYSVYLFGTKRTVGLVLTYSAAVLFRYVANIIVQTITDGILPTSVDLVTALLGFILDILTAFAVLLIAHLCFKNFDSSKKKNACLPFGEIYNAQNPLQKASLITGILLASEKVLSRVIYDIGYGAPTSILDLLRMMVYYISDVLICVVIYLASLLLIMHLDKKDN